MTTRFVLVALAAAFLPAIALAAAPKPSIPPDVVGSTVTRLIVRFGAAHADRIKTGVRQVAERWWESDGDAKAFAAFCEEHFITDPAELSATTARLEEASEQVEGHLLEIGRELRRPFDLETGPIGKADRLLGDLDLASHLGDDLFATKVAFLALLNFPVHTLAERLAAGPAWDREAWARSRMMDGFAERVPAEIAQRASKALNAADLYIAEYDIRMDRLTADGAKPFPEGKRLISHWGLRDELKALYAEGSAGLPRQRMIAKVMERIVRQEIPAAVRGNGDLLWNPFTNAVTVAPGAQAPAGVNLTAREPDTRYGKLLDVYRALREADPYSPTAPTYIKRKFEIERQIPEDEVEKLLISVLASDEVRALGRRIAARLGRPLEPFDIWYAGFSPAAGRSEAELNAEVGRRYPTVAAFQSDLPRILGSLGFSEAKARYLADHIVVDPARGAGHAMGAERRQDQAHLRTRIPAGGMDYKGYNIAIHELGHNVEQVFSLHGIDHWVLSGVPNNAFTEAFAFVFQRRDLELLGLGSPGPDAARMEALKDLWDTYEIGGVALVDLAAWRWMYAHPDATPAQLREAVLAAARDVWNRYYAPVFGLRDSEILAIYSHMISYPLYLADYPLGHIIAFQVARKLRAGDFGADFERMARQGRLTPDAWMRGAVGGPISARALLDEAKGALAAGD